MNGDDDDDDSVSHRSQISYWPSSAARTNTKVKKTHEGWKPPTVSQRETAYAYMPCAMKV